MVGLVQMAMYTRGYVIIWYEIYAPSVLIHHNIGEGRRLYILFSNEATVFLSSEGLVSHVPGPQ